MKSTMFAALAALALGCSAAVAQDDDAAAEAFFSQLQYQQGTVAVEGANARLALDPTFKYLGARDARRVLEEAWGNPPDDTVLGMVVPSDIPLQEQASWAVVVTSSDEGYVSDEEAAETDYDAMLADLQAATEEDNEARQAQGYPTVHLLGWAAPPRYDAANKKLYWAKELQFQDAEEPTVNYDVRVLGRRGYLSLNAVAQKSSLPAVEAGMQRLIPLASFVEGERYADFNPSTDKLAAYGLAALVGGGLAAKAGLFGKLFAALLAAKKIVIPLLIGAVALGARLLGRKKDSTAA
jgi:uncharacterized membrane-anchored protein